MRGRPPVQPPELAPLDAESTEPIDRQVYNAIRRSLMSGAIMPGAKLSSRSIAGALGVSSMPVREALKRLDADGVLRSTAKSSFMVREFTAKEYQEILAVRLPLEGLLTRTATENIADNEIDQVWWLLDRMKASNSWRQLLHYNYKMHFIIYRKADMPYVLSLVENIWLRVGPILHKLNLKKDQSKEEQAAHLHSLADALQARDAVRAEKALHKDILMNAEELMKSLKNADAESALNAA